MKGVVLGTAGHIDHGKTTLLKALTGIDPDRLKEEKERGITTDVGFAPWISPPYHIGFIDVPGHERFISNMLVGAGAIDGVVLVVAATEGPMPQTREHLDIASLLGVRTGIVVVTKTDAADGEMLHLVREEIVELVSGTFLEGAPVVPFSARTGSGMEDLKDAVRHLADEAGDRDASGIPRLFVDRVFTVKGFGTVVTGTVKSGEFRRGDAVVLHPSGVEGRVRNIQAYERDVESARVGQRAALNVGGIPVESARRGAVVTSGGRVPDTRFLHVRLRLLEPFGKILKDGAAVHVHLGTAQCVGHIRLLDADRLEPGESCFARVRLETPQQAWPGDRFVVRQYSPLATMGGGVVLDNQPRKPPRSAMAALVGELDSLEKGTPKDRVAVFTRQAGARGETTAGLSGRTGLSVGLVESLLGELENENRVVSTPPGGAVWVDRVAVADTGAALLRALGEHHRQKPCSPGMSREELRQLCGFAREEVFSFAVEQLASRGDLAVDGARMSLPGRAGGLSCADERASSAAGAALLSAGAKGLGEADVRRFIAGAMGDPSLLDRLIQLKEAVRVGPDYYVHTDVMERVVLLLREKTPRGGEVEVGDFKDWLGLTRKRAIPLLECLDRRGVTFRTGSGRRMR